MPIINAANSIWLTGEVYLPTTGINTYAVFNNFSSKQISDRSAATDIVYGSPYEKIWDVGHTYWQTEFSCPLLIPQVGYNPSAPYYNSIQIIADFLQEMLRPLGFKQGDTFSSNTFKNKWDFTQTENITSSNADYIIQKISIDITDTDASFSVSIISTMDIRAYFKVFSKNNPGAQNPFLDSVVYRTVMPWDINIPDGNIGSPLGFIQSSVRQWPIQTVSSTNYTSLLREFHITLESTTIQTPSIGIPTSRTFIGVNSIKSSGNIKYIPLYISGATKSFQLPGAGFSPAGIEVDMASIDYISNTTRHGGKLQVSMDMVSPMYVQALIRNRNVYIVNGKNAVTPLGPVSIASWGLNTRGGQTNEISVDFVTSPGIISF